MINSRIIGVGRVGVKRLSLHVVELECLIIIVQGDGVGNADNILFVGLVRLQTLEGIGLVQSNIIDVVKMRRVLHDVFVETRERVVEDGLSAGSVNEGLDTDVESIVYLVVSILVMLVFGVDTRAAIGTSHSFIFTVSVDAPEVVNTVMDGLGVTEFGDEGWNESKENNILCFELENGRTDSESGNFI